MINNNDVCILHVDGSLTECLNKKNNEIINYMGIGGYIVINGNVKNSFSKSYKNKEYSNHHEEYAIIEGLKWVRKLGISNVTIKTDSLNSVNLFNMQKIKLNNIDKFFLVQFLSLEFDFESINIVYHKRSQSDLAHIMAKKYIEEIFLDLSLEKVHSMRRKDKNYLNLYVKDKLFNNKEEIKKNLKQELKCIINYQHISHNE